MDEHAEVDGPPEKSQQQQEEHAVKQCHSLPFRTNAKQVFETENDQFLSVKAKLRAGHQGRAERHQQQGNKEKCQL